ncbi:hypothetical protein SAMN05444166_5946 [Singulisphaera sp. GP187]|uniref:hypothetical protein n=1 Tax=Singulisphaera sp. GP187 TaxID=1882752 RepID=UPI000928B440|nr:hypothetical protein [Singulisphaera sp. GP187]SIO59158.1 hypothetical protein SAMN05444166_5946 [Singulisphaera sp. GP187]
MATQGTQQSTQTTVERNTHRLDRLIHEVEILVDLLEEQRLVEPSSLVPLKKELREMQRGK